MMPLLIAFCLVLLAAGDALAAPGFSWFHTRPKSVVLLDETSTGTVKQTRVPYHGSEMYPSSGRLYFQDKIDKTRGVPVSQTRSRMTSIFSKGWSGTSSKTATSKSAKAK